MKIVFPVFLRSEGNIHDHWTARKKRKDVIKMLMRSQLAGMEKPGLPCKIIFTRIAPRSLDIDNLWFSMKVSIDAISDWLIPGLPPGKADSDERIEIACKQKKGKPREYALEVEFLPQEALKQGQEQ